MVFASILFTSMLFTSMLFTSMVFASMVFASVIYRGESPFSNLYSASRRPNPKMEVVVSCFRGIETQNIVFLDFIKPERLFFKK